MSLGDGAKNCDEFFFAVVLGCVTPYAGIQRLFDEVGVYMAAEDDDADIALRDGKGLDRVEGAYAW